MSKLRDFFLSDSGGEAGEAGDRPEPASGDLSAVKAELGRNRKRLSKAERAAAETELEAALDRLYTPRRFKGPANAYFRARFVITGDDDFLLTEEESNDLAEGMAETARLLITIDYRYMAAILFGCQFGEIIASKEVKHYQKRRAAKRQASGSAVVPIRPS